MSLEDLGRFFVSLSPPAPPPPAPFLSSLFNPGQF